MSDAYKLNGKSWTNRIVGHDHVPPDQLLANPFNYRIHSKSQQDAMAGALSEIGWIQDVIINKSTGHLIDGHLRVSLALRNGESAVPVKYVDLTEDEERLALATFDPITAMATHDAELLDGLLKGINTADEALQAMLAELAQEAGLYPNRQEAADAEPQTSRKDELQAEWGTAVGQVWRLGKHRLVIGDCTEAAVVKRLLGGERPLLMVTDPPYGIEHKNDAIPTDNHKEHFGIDNDSRDIEPFVEKFIEAHKWFQDAFYIFGAYVQFSVWYTRLSGWRKVNQVLVWVKDNAVLSRLHFNLKFEIIYHGYTSSGVWNGDNTQDDVLMHRNVNSFGYIKDDGARNAKNDAQVHPNQKPLDLIGDLIKLSSNAGDLVYDSFVGSGTTIIACQNLNRQCRAIEIDPGYAAVTLQRYLDAFAIKPELVERGG